MVTPKWFSYGELYVAMFLWFGPSDSAFRFQASPTLQLVTSTAANMSPNQFVTQLLPPSLQQPLVPWGPCKAAVFHLTPALSCSALRCCWALGFADSIFLLIIWLLPKNDHHIILIHTTLHQASTAASGAAAWNKWENPLATNCWQKKPPVWDSEHTDLPLHLQDLQPHPRHPPHQQCPPAQ